MNNKLSKFLERVRKYIFLLIVILFPLNQQLHLRPFPSIDGRIIDYLIIKISIVEILLILLTLVNLPLIFKCLKSLFKSKFNSLISLSLIVTLITLNCIESKYPILSFYENTIIVLIILNSLVVKEFLNQSISGLIIKSIKIWMVLLIILGLLQLFYQSSVLNSYKYFGEFPYESSNYHIKQDGLLFDNLIPAYGIFSHSNIYGAFFLVSIMFLYSISKPKILYLSISILGVLISGSLNILICLGIFLLFYYLKLNLKFLYYYLFFCLIALNILSLNFQKYEENHSIYRRVYMVSISNQSFYEKPFNFLFGFGYYNYFDEVSEKLYRYEIIRFFQPPHNLLYLLIWSYGFIFTSLIVLLFVKFMRIISKPYKLLFAVILAVSMFDHFFFTNHQLKMLVFLILPYSLKGEFGIRIS